MPTVTGRVATDFALRLRPVATPAFVRLGLASVLSAGVETTCTPQRARELITVLATSPFAPVDCQSARRLDDDAVLPPVLAPGHNKNALFGPAFSPRRDDDDS
jgi:hypothetical protein